MPPRLNPVTHMIRLRRAAALLVASSLAANAFALNARMEATTTWAENIARTSSPVDWRDTLRAEARGTLSLSRELTTSLLVTPQFAAEAAWVPRYADAHVFALGPGVNFRQKFGLGAYAPVLEAGTTLAFRETGIPGDRGWVATGTLRASKRLTPAWRVAAFGEWKQQYAPSAVFDLRHQLAGGTLAWDISERWQLTYGRSWLWGDFTANASSAIWARALSGALGESIANYYNQAAWSVTDTFGSGWVTYRVKGKVRAWWLELSPALGRNTSLPLRYERVFAINKVNVAYWQDLWSISLLHRF